MKRCTLIVRVVPDPPDPETGDNADLPRAPISGPFPAARRLQREGENRRGDDPIGVVDRGVVIGERKDPDTNRGCTGDGQAEQEGILDARWTLE